jgi:hypothetical protein
MIWGRQTREVYKHILKSRDGITIADIASKLRISASDVYRLTMPLLKVGLILKNNERPFKLFAGGGGLDLFLATQSEWFTENFKDGNPKRKSNNMSFNFVQGRDELMKVSITEMDDSVKSIDILRSGREIPSDTMFSMISAIKRGVKVHMLIQEYDRENKEMVGNWIRNGVEVRFTKAKNIRIMVFDSEVGYFMSYRHSDSGQDLGMKIDYEPFALMLSQYFASLWKKAKVIR